MNLFDPKRHESLVAAEAWDADAARRAIRAIAADAIAASRDGLWPSHPLEDGPIDEGRTLYMGAAGIIWALFYLASEGAIVHDDRLVKWALALPALYESAPDTGSVVPSYFLGDTAVLLLALRLRPTEPLSDRLFASVERNVRNPTLEALWGAPGTVLAAVFAHELDSEPRFRKLILSNLAALNETWQRDEGAGCDIWTQDLYGRKRRMLGAAHGFAGNVFAYLRASAVLPTTFSQSAFERALHTLRTTAVIHGDQANWPILVGGDNFLTQWCHGAPGIITSFAGAPSHAELDDLLVKGGELTWQAGPLRKGPSLCHGTAGNGAALLALFSRTRDPKWLDRARLFAMHSIHQVAEARKAYGQGRYSLWTGDLGVAIYLWQCIAATSGMPSLDF